MTFLRTSPIKHSKPLALVLQAVASSPNLQSPLESSVASDNPRDSYLLSLATTTGHLELSHKNHQRLLPSRLLFYFDDGYWSSQQHANGAYTIIYIDDTFSTKLKCVSKIASYTDEWWPKYSTSILQINPSAYKTDEIIFITLFNRSFT